MDHERRTPTGQMIRMDAGKSLGRKEKRTGVSSSEVKTSRSSNQTASSPPVPSRCARRSSVVGTIRCTANSVDMVVRTYRWENTSCAGLISGEDVQTLRAR